MFGVYEGTKRPLNNYVPPVIAKITAAMLSGTTEAVLTPFERIQTLLQNQNYQQQFRNTTHAIHRLSEFNSYRGEPLKRAEGGHAHVKISGKPNLGQFRQFPLKDYQPLYTGQVCP